MECFEGTKQVTSGSCAGPVRRRARGCRRRTAQLSQPVQSSQRHRRRSGSDHRGGQPKRPSRHGRHRGSLGALLQRSQTALLA